MSTVETTLQTSDNAALLHISAGGETKPTLHTTPLHHMIADIGLGHVKAVIQRHSSGEVMH